MAEYDYVKDPVRPDVLAREASAAGVSVDYVNASKPDVYVFTPRILTPAEKSTLDSVVAAHDGRQRQLRPLWSIRADVQALTAAQWGNVWADLSAPVAGKAPRKYLMDYGVNAGPIFVFDWSLYVTGPTAAQVKAGQISLTALYVQDNPSYLIRPPFDSSIDVDGTEPIP